MNERGQPWYVVVACVCTLAGTNSQPSSFAGSRLRSKKARIRRFLSSLVYLQNSAWYMRAQHINAHVWWCHTLSYDNVWSTSSLSSGGWWVKLMVDSARPTKIERWRTRWEGGEKMLWASQCNPLPLNLPTVESQADRSMFRSSETIIVVTSTLSMWKILSPQPVGS